MAPIGRRLFLPALALTVVACATAGGFGATAELAAAPRVAAEHDFPRTYHIYGSDKGLPALARYDMVVGYAYWNVRVLRKRNPSGIFLLVPGLQPKSERDYRGLSVTYGAVDLWKGGRDRIRGGRNLGHIRAFDPFWDQLYNADGSRAEVSSRWRHEGWNLADPRRKGTPMLVAKVIAHASKRGGLYAKGGWDGIHSDNWIYRIGADWFYGSQLDTDRDGQVDDYAVLRRHWARGLTRVGDLLRSYLPGKIVGGNGNWNVRSFSDSFSRPDDHLRSANYTLLEDLQLYVGREDEIVDSIHGWLAYKDPRGQPRHFAVMHRLGGEGEFQAMRWGLSLATIAGAYYEAYARLHTDTFWYDEYDGGLGVRERRWLGAPLTGPTKLPNGVWRRDFENGVVLNNSTSAPQPVALGATYQRLAGTQDPNVNNGTPVTDVTLAPRDGIFLRRIAPS